MFNKQYALLLSLVVTSQRIPSMARGSKRLNRTGAEYVAFNITNN